MVAQLVRALACHARGRGFEPHPSRHFRARFRRREVGAPSESPFSSLQPKFNSHADLAHLVERHLAKVEVAGSSPVIRSKETVKTVSFFTLNKARTKVRDPFESHSRETSPAQVCGLSCSLLCLTSLEKTTLSCFFCANP